MMEGMLSKFGLRIIGSPLIPEKQPALKLSHDVPVSDKFRMEMDAWLFDQFGERSYAYIFDPKLIGMVGGEFIVMNPNLVTKLNTKQENK